METELLFSHTMTELDFQKNRLRWSYLDLKGRKCWAYTELRGHQQQVGVEMGAPHWFQFLPLILLESNSYTCLEGTVCMASSCLSTVYSSWK